MGFFDFAGSTVVHSVGGWAALAGAILLGARKGKYNADGSVNAMPGSNMPLATLGMFILWMGWFGFNGASQLAMGTVGDIADVGRIMANTNAGAVGGALAALILTQLIYKKVDLTFVLNGALAGLVSITAEPLTPGLGTATLIGAVGGVIVVFAGARCSTSSRSTTSSAPSRSTCSPASGARSRSSSPMPTPASWPQLVAIVVIGVFVFVASFVVWPILKATIGLRPTEEDEVLGLDKAEVGVEAYPEFGANRSADRIESRRGGRFRRPHSRPGSPGLFFGLVSPDETCPPHGRPPRSAAAHRLRHRRHDQRDAARRRHVRAGRMPFPRNPRRRRMRNPCRPRPCGPWLKPP